LLLSVAGPSPSLSSARLDTEGVGALAAALRSNTTLTDQAEGTCSAVAGVAGAEAHNAGAAVPARLRTTQASVTRKVTPAAADLRRLRAATGTRVQRGERIRRCWWVRARVRVRPGDRRRTASGGFVDEGWPGGVSCPNERRRREAKVVRRNKNQSELLHILRPR
jgi:hypothetical protein